MKKAASKTSRTTSATKRTRAGARGSRAANSRAAKSRRSTTGTARRRKAPLNREWLRGYLSEMLTVEKAGLRLYEKALNELSHEELRDRLERYHEQTQRHIELCEEMLEAAGADRDYMSQEAQVAEQKGEALVSSEAPEEARDRNNIENLLLAETKCDGDWEMLDLIYAEIEERDLRQTVRRAVGQVLKQERDHVKWMNDTLRKLLMEMAHQPEEGEQEGQGYDNNGSSDEAEDRA